MDTSSSIVVFDDSCADGIGVACQEVPSQASLADVEDHTDVSGADPSDLSTNESHDISADDRNSIPDNLPDNLSADHSTDHSTDHSADHSTDDAHERSAIDTNELSASDLSENEDPNDPMSLDAFEDSSEQQDTGNILPLEAIIEMAEEALDQMLGAESSLEITTHAVKLLRASSQDYVSKIFATASNLSRHAGRDFIGLTDLKMAREIAGLWVGRKHSQDVAVAHGAESDNQSSTNASGHDDGGASSSLEWLDEGGHLMDYATRFDIPMSDPTSSAEEEMSSSDIDQGQPEATNVDMSSVDEDVSDVDPYRGWFKVYEDGEVSSEGEDDPAANTTDQHSKGEHLSSQA